MQVGLIIDYKTKLFNYIFNLQFKEINATGDMANCYYKGIILIAPSIFPNKKINFLKKSMKIYFYYDIFNHNFPDIDISKNRCCMRQQQSVG